MEQQEKDDQMIKEFRRIIQTIKKNVLNNNHLTSYQQILKNKAIIVLKI